MKRILVITLLVGLFAAQADAYLFELTKDFALQLTEYTLDPTTSTADEIGTLTVYDGPDIRYGDMSGLVGFEGGQMYDLDADDYLTAMVFGDITGLGLSGSSDGITSYFQNDNDNFYSLQLFAVNGSIDADGTITGTEYAGNWEELAGYGDSTYLTIDALGLDLSTIDFIGFRIQAHIGAGPGYPTQGDVFHISMTPVPTAVILSVLGLGVVGLKLRKYA
jgi:hypothetical protein